MSEQDEQRPLTRRERRLREMAETGALDLSEVADAPAPADGETADAGSRGSDGAAPPAPEDEIEISPFNEDGTPRSRREMRQLREEALAARQASSETPEQPGASEPSSEPEAAVGSSDSRNAPAVPEAEAAAEPEVAAEPEQDPEVAAEPEREPEVAAEVATEPQVAAAPDAQAAGADSSVAAAPEAGGDPTPETAGEPPFAAREPAVPEPAVAEPAPGEVDFDTLIAPPTEPFTVSELREAEEAPEHASPESPEADSADTVQSDSATVPETVPDAADLPASDDVEASKPKRRFPWQRSKDAAPATPEGDQPVEAAETDSAAGPASAGPAARETGDGQTAPEGDPAATTAIPEVADAATTAIPAARFSGDHESPSVPETDSAAEIDSAQATREAGASPAASEEASQEGPEAASPEQGPEAASPEQGPEAASPEEKTSYSFPDIAPPEEWRSVFDDPASRNFPTPGNTRDDGDFDDLISRAVAQEGSTGGTGTAALILPSMPDDTGGLTGPLGGTGDLYLTGSLKLPKSLGETGGHSALHDSIEMDPITGEQTGDPQTTGRGPAPVSARHAVSALVPSGVPVVAKPTKERSKLPLVLSLTGGGLLIVVVGLGVWGASNGMFG